MWRKTADALRETAVSDAGTQSDGRGVNKNGAPLLGDTRDLFRPKTSDIPAQPGVYKWRDGEGRAVLVHSPAVGLGAGVRYCGFP